MASLELVTLIVENYDPAIEFFVEKLGFDLVEDSASVTHDGRPKRWVVVRPRGGQTGVLLAQADGTEQASTVGGQVAGRVGFFLRVDDFDRSFDRMVSDGVEFVTPPRTESYGRVAVFLDVSGNRWDLLGPSETRPMMMGDPLWAVLIPPRLTRFRELVQIGDEQLDVDFTGWNKFVVLAAERAYLFPRKANDVEWFERELAAYRVLEPIGLPIVPRLLGEWRDETIYPYPFAAVSRLPGTHPADASYLLDQLGRAIAQWHEISPPEIPDSRPPAHHDRSDTQWLRRALDPGTTRAGRCGGSRSPRLRRSTRTVERADGGGRVCSHTSWCTATSTRTNSWSSMGSSQAFLTGRPHASTTPFGTSISASGEQGFGVVTGSSSHGCGR